MKTLNELFKKITWLIDYKGDKIESSYMEGTGKAITKKDGTVFELHPEYKMFKVIEETEIEFAIVDDKNVKEYQLDFGSVTVKALGKTRKATKEDLEGILMLISKK